MSADIIDFAAARQRRQDQRRVQLLTQQGLTTRELGWIGAAANRAFNETIPPVDEVGALGLGRLGYLRLGVTEKDDGVIYTLGNAEAPTLHYFRSDGALTNEWHEEGFVGLDLTTHTDPGRLATEWIMSILNLRGLDVLSLYGFFALDCFYFICTAPDMHPLHIQYSEERGYVAMILHDATIDCDVVLMAHLDTWKASEADCAAATKELAPQIPQSD